jgi:hypothetical protein
MTDPITRNELRQELQESERRIKELFEATITPIREDVERSSYALFGNGDPGLTTRMKVVEDRQSKMAVFGAIATLVASAVAGAVGVMRH